MKNAFLALSILYNMTVVNAQSTNITSTLEVFDLETNQRTTILTEDGHFEAPNWSRDGRFFIINQNGGLFKVGMDGKKEAIYTGWADKCNNDHGISPDGNTLVLSHSLEDGEDGWLTSCIFTVPVTGGEPVRITAHTPSFWHGWSPDGETLVYTAKLGDNFDIYSIPARGGDEIQLTNSDGLDDGPDYSPDGKHIYYNTIQSGSMEIWRMKADGSDKKQLTDDPYSNWFPHPSPDGQHIVFISYLEDQGSAHPAMKKVALKLYNVAHKTIKTLCAFTGGQGSLNVPSWSPDGKRFAFVSYAYKN